MKHYANSVKRIDDLTRMITITDDVIGVKIKKIMLGRVDRRNGKMHNLGKTGRARSLWSGVDNLQ